MNTQTIEFASLIAIFIIGAIAFSMRTFTVNRAPSRKSRNSIDDSIGLMHKYDSMFKSNEKFNLYTLTIENQEYITTDLTKALDFCFSNPECRMKCKVRSMDKMIPEVSPLNEFIPSGRLKA